MDDGLLMEMRFDAQARLVSPMRRFVEEALEKFVDDTTVVSRVATAAHELLENASKYARNGKAAFSVELTGEAERRLALRLTNLIAPDDLRRLRQLFAEIDACGDPLTFYIALMRRSARQMSKSAGMGLARIRAECEMALALTVDGDEATIVAEAAVPARGHA